MIVLAIILGLLLFLLLIPVGVDASWMEGELRLDARVCGLKISLYPKKPSEKPKKEKKTKKAEEDAPAKAKPKKKLSFNFQEIVELLRTALKAVGNFGRKLRVDRFLLHYLAAGDDPYKTARTFGLVNAALSGLAPICAKRYRVRDCDVWTRVDFTAEEMQLDLALALRIRVGQLLAVAFSLAFGAMRIFLRNRRRLRAQNPAADNNTDNKGNTPCEENTKTEEGLE